MRYYIRPAAGKCGISKEFGWHTFRHTYSTLLRAVGADIKVMQELLRHASSRVTMDTYTQAVTSAKRLAQSAVVSLFHREPDPPAIRVAPGAAENSSAAGVVPFCAHQKTGQSPQAIDSEVASPTGFDPCYRRERRSGTGIRCKYKAAVAHECPVRSRWEGQGTCSCCTVLVPRGFEPECRNNGRIDILASEPKIAGFSPRGGFPPLLRWKNAPRIATSVTSHNPAVTKLDHERLFFLSDIGLTQPRGASDCQNYWRC